MIKRNQISKFIGICLMLLSFGTLVARDFEKSPYNQRIVSINTGYVFSGSGDCWGTNNEISHFKSFSPSLFHRQSLEGWIINGDSWIEGAFENQTGISLTAEIGLVPFKIREHILYLSGGAVIGFISNIRPDGGASYNFGSGDSFQVLNRVDYRANGSFAPGFSMSAGFIARVNSKIYLNIRAQTKMYNSGDVLSTLSIGIGLNALKK